MPYDGVRPCCYKSVAFADGEVEREEPVESSIAEDADDGADG